MKPALLFIAFACFAAAPLIAAEAAPSPKIEIESKFIELPNAMADALKFPGRESFMDKFPGKLLPTMRSPLRAVLDEKDAEQLLATLDSQKGVDICSAPKVTLPQQRRSEIEIIREFRHPTEWNPPDTTEKRWTPKAFETRKVGVTLQITPTLMKDGLIDLDLEPAVTEFLGFVDFETGKPFFAVEADLTKTPVDRTLGSQRERDFEFPNRPTKTVFSTRKTRVGLTVKPGQTVVIDGLDESEKIEPLPPARPGFRIIALVRARPIP